ncbi:ribosome biogenesis GTPase YlqF [Metamycoplasma equirhinis]|uniref:ribosome biogenesis GTPase YlqF n=1 Tax=Metamycoplasma equirhinis TaxID=92402 RepID=UPI003593AE81
MIHWFPGHMAKQFKLLKEKQKLFDLFIILLDSRIPVSSFNNEIYKIANNKPILFVLNKSDMSDIIALKDFAKEYEKRGKVVITNLKSKLAYNQINNALNKYYQELKIKNAARGKLTPALKCVVLGVPNVGKSTLINLLAKSKVAKVGAIAGITRSEQWINCKNYLLLDTPGLLIPKIENNEVGAKLALVGSIRYESLNRNELIVELYKLMSKYYPSKLTEIGLTSAFEDEDIFENITLFARSKNLLLSAGKYDINKAISMLIIYFKNLTNVIFDKRGQNE